ncbi:Membrane protein involved in the export of O-antigen and teichoic acid [Lachnospiraceae bacterium]|nr:Membrane protein involved in the export of O-antigen and teichoic acid [Lachnospiraceae bacterium]
MKKKDFFKNIISGFGGQLIVIILGVIIPRVMITSYGSDANGLVSTTTQIFSYLALLEAGIGQSARVALYKPIACNNKEEISSVVLSAESYFRRITYYYGLGVIVLSAIIPFVIKSELSHLTILLVFLLEGMSGVISFYFIQTPTVLLNADGKGYVNNSINLVNKILGYLSKIILAYFGISIVLIQFVFFLITLIKVIFYRLYIRKKYYWIENEKGKPDYSILKDKNSYLLTEIAWTIFSSTDMIVLSLFISTKLSSVYSVYNLIYSNINLLLNAVAGSILYVLGQVYHRSIKEYEDVHDSMNTVFIGSITILVSVSYILTIPFIKLYTNGVSDVKYVYEQLPLMFAMVQLLSWSRYVNGNLTALGGYAKSTSYISLVEAIVNVVLSIVLVNKFGIVGVLIATVLALPVKVLWCIYISDKIILNRSYKKTVIITGSNYLFFFAVVFLNRFLHMDILSYGAFAFKGFLTAAVIGVMGVGLNILVNRNCLSVMKKYIFKRE